MTTALLERLTHRCHTPETGNDSFHFGKQLGESRQICNGESPERDERLTPEPSSTPVQFSVEAWVNSRRKSTLNRVFADERRAWGHGLGRAGGVADRPGAGASARHITQVGFKQVDRLLGNTGIVLWDLFGAWGREVVGERREIVVGMDWTDFDADNQAALALHLVTNHGRATLLLWFTVDNDELKDLTSPLSNKPRDDQRRDSVAAALPFGP